MEDAIGELSPDPTSCGGPRITWSAAPVAQETLGMKLGRIPWIWCGEHDVTVWPDDATDLSE